MTIINPNSIAGITSVTAEAGVMNFYKSDGTLAGLQLNGVNFNTTAGVSTFNDVYVGGTITYEDVKNVDSVGVITARAGVNISGGNLQIDGTNVINSGRALYNVESVKLADTKNLILGTSNDLKIYHSGSHSFISEEGQGALKVKGDDVRFENASGTEALRIDSSGRLLIGTTTEGLGTYGEDLTIGSSDHAGITLRTGTGHKGTIYFSDGTSGAAEYKGSVQYDHNDDSLRFASSGAEKLRIDSAGNLLVGSSDNRTINSHVPRLQVTGTTYSHATVSIINNANDSNGAYLFFGKQRSGSPGGSTVVQDDDIVGHLRFSVGDGTDMESRVAYIEAFVDGTPGSNDTPGRLTFSTTPDGAANPVERLRITSGGILSWTSGSTVMSGTGNSYSLNIYRDGGSGYAYLDCVTGSSNHTGWYMRAYHNGTYNKVIAHNTSDWTWFETGGIERLRIDSAGNMGLGVAPIAPGHTTLHIGNSTSSQPVRLHMTTNGTGATASDGFTLSIDGSSSAVNLIQRESADMIFYTAGTERLRITDNGLKVGTSVDNNYAVIHAHGGSATRLHLTSSNTGTTTSDGAIIMIDSSSNMEILNKENTNLEFFTNNSERMRLTAGGALNIGAVSPTVSDNGQFNCYTTTSSGKAQFVHDAGAGGLRLAGTGSGSGANLVFSNNYNSGTFSDHWTLTHNGGDDSFRFLSGGTGGTERLRLQADGKLIKYGTNINLNSAYIDFSGSISTPSTAAAIYRPADNTLAFSTANTERMRINNIGNVGIGAAPEYDLDIKAGSSARVAIDCSTGSDAAIIMDGINADFAGSDYYQIKAQSSGEFAVFKASSERVRITPDGDIGINCTPTANDLASGSSFAIPKMMIQGPTSDSSHHLLRLNAGTDADWNAAILTLNHSNDRGIAIYGGRSNSNRSWGAIKSIDNLGRVSDCINIVGGSGQGVNRIEFYTNESTTTIERMRINSGGRVDIRCNSEALRLRPLSDGHAVYMEFYDDANSTRQGFFGFGANTETTSTMHMHNNRNGQLEFRTNNTVHFRINNNGDLQGTDTSISSLSDSRLKKNIADFAYDLSKFKQFKPKTFEWINTDKHNSGTQRGFIAQDLEGVDAELTGEASLDAELQASDITTLGGSGTAKTARLGKNDTIYVSVIQQLITKIETLEAKVAALEA